MKIKQKTPRLRIPKYPRREHRSGKARICIPGRGDVYLPGAFNSEESLRAYGRIVQELSSRGGVHLDPKLLSGPSIVELIASFLVHLERKSRRHAQVRHARTCMRFLRKLYGDMPVADFRAFHLEAVRDAWLEAEKPRGGKYCSSTINNGMTLIQTMFTWGAVKELVPPSVSHLVSVVGRLKPGESSAPVPKKVRPVSDEVVRATLPFLTPTLAAMVQLQMLTGARSGELCIMRGADLDTSGDGLVWHFRPRFHKTDRFGTDRVIPIGPAGQAILRPYLCADAARYLFRPYAIKLEWMRMECAAFARRTAARCGNEPFTLIGSRRAEGMMMKRSSKEDELKYHADRLKHSRWCRLLAACGMLQVVSKLERSRYQTYRVSPGDIEEHIRAYFRAPALIKERELPEAHYRESLSPNCYWRSIRRAADAADAAAHIADPKAPASVRLVPRWHPHQIRHTFATLVRKKYSLEDAMEMLGHEDERTTRSYAQMDYTKLDRIAAAIG